MGDGLNQNYEALLPKPRATVEFAAPLGLSAAGRRKER